MEAVKVAAIIQARTNSTRFPGKINQKIGNKTLLEMCIDSAKLAEEIDLVIIATTNNEDDTWIRDKFHKLNEIVVFEGDENDVLSRFVLAARKYNVDIITRLTSDDPFKPPWLIDKLVRKVKQNNLDYASNTLNPTFPEGLDIEVFSRNALEKANKLSEKPSEREHVTPYIWNHPLEFRCFSEVIENDLSWARLTVDYPSDLDRMREIWKILGSSALSEKILNFLQTNNYLINLAKTKILRNEGYYKSIKED